MNWRNLKKIEKESWKLKSIFIVQNTESWYKDEGVNFYQILVDINCERPLTPKRKAPAKQQLDSFEVFIFGQGSNPQPPDPWAIVSPQGLSCFTEDHVQKMGNK